jgi:excisionase family DNA binding protein
MLSKTLSQTTPVSLVLRPKQAANALGISMTTFWRLVKSGQLETIKIGPRTTGVRRSDIERLVEHGIALKKPKDSNSR